jgi:hypothetical protein
MRRFTTPANVVIAEEGVLRLRAIASVGVLLCAATTSFSIYLGIVEHVYSPPRIHTDIYVGPQGQKEEYCFTLGNTTTTSPDRDVKRVPCNSSDRP